MRTVLVAEHVDHAFDAQRLTRVDAHDAALGDAGRDDAAMGEAGSVVLGSVFCRAGDFRVAIDSGSGGADVGHGSAHRMICLRRNRGAEACLFVRLLLTESSCWTAIAACRARPASGRERWRGGPARS